MTRPDVQEYLRSIIATYAQWWERYTLTDAVGREKIKRQTEKFAFPFDFGLMVQTVKPQPVEDLAKEETPEKLAETLERLPVLEGLRKYAAEHVLLMGQPGSGKSTALIRLLLEEATNHDDAAKIPVLVELRYWQTGVGDRILAGLHKHDPALDVDAATLKSWLRQGRLLLLMDGLNELPSEEARRDVATFRQDYAQTPMIFTTRELSIGGDLGIAKKLEMQPLTETQMQAFVRAYLPPNQAEQMLHQLKERLQEFGQTPLLLWMLCGLFQQRGTVPPNLGLVFRQFTQGYERSLKQDVPATDESRGWWSLLLQRLSFAMMQGENPQEKPTEFLVAIARPVAEEILTQYLTEEKFDKPRNFAKQWLEDLLKHHLIQENGDTIEFRHQLIQEYYAAEHLLRQLPKLSNEALQRHYLNYLKWTEPIALMLALVEDEAQEVRVVELAIDVDLMLGARLAGEGKREFQQQTLSVLSALEISILLKIRLLGSTHSDCAISLLTLALADNDSDVRSAAVNALGQIGSQEAASCLLTVLEDKDSTIYGTAASWLGKIGGKNAVNVLLKDLNHEKSDFRQQAAEALGEINNNKDVISALCSALNDEEVRLYASLSLKKIKNQIEISIPCQDLVDEVLARYQGSKNIEHIPPSRADKTTKQIANEVSIPILLQELEHGNLLRYTGASIELKRIGTPELLSQLYSFLPTNKKISPLYLRHILDLISAIQSRCKFYNYEIFQAALEPENSQTENLEKTAIVNHYHFPNAQEAKIFERVEKYINNPND